MTSDIFRSFWLNLRPLIHYLSNAMYGCPTRLRLLMTFGQLFLQTYNLLYTSHGSIPTHMLFFKDQTIAL